MKNCLECEEKITGREDKKFCCDGCRNAYNNRANKDTTNFMRTVNNRLRRNYRILNELNSAGKARIAKSKLTGKGFDFEFFTNVRETRTGIVYFFLYDQGYRPVSDEHYILIKKPS